VVFGDVFVGAWGCWGDGSDSGSVGNVEVRGKVPVQSFLEEENFALMLIGSLLLASDKYNPTHLLLYLGILCDLPVHHSIHVASTDDLKLLFVIAGLT